MGSLTLMTVSNKTVTALESQLKNLVNFKNYYNKVSDCSWSQNKSTSGKAGDQTGQEWYIGNWKNKSWDYVLRYPDKEVGECIAWLSIMAAKNNNIGYDQGDRTSYWTQLKKVKYDPSKIKTKCEVDCSSAVSSNVKAAGYLLNKAALKNVSISSTSTLKANLQKAGFKVYSAKKYLTSSAYLIPGDILLHVGHHAEVSLGIGSKTGYKCLYEQTQLALKSIKSELKKQQAALKKASTSTKTVTATLSTKANLNTITGTLISGAKVSPTSSTSGTQTASNSIANALTNNLTGTTFSKDAQTTNPVAVIGI